MVHAPNDSLHFKLKRRVVAFVFFSTFCLHMQWCNAGHLGWFAWEWPLAFCCCWGWHRQWGRRAYFFLGSQQLAPSKGRIGVLGKLAVHPVAVGRLPKNSLFCLTCKWWCELCKIANMPSEKISKSQKLPNIMNIRWQLGIFHCF